MAETGSPVRTVPGIHFLADQSRWREHWTSGLARNLVVSYSVDSDRVRLILDLEDVDIALDTAIPCGLIVNEIVSNSFI